MPLTRKKLQKNLPYLFVFLALGAIVGYRSYTEMQPPSGPAPALTAAQQDYMQHRIASAPYDAAPVAGRQVVSGSFVEIGRIHQDAEGRTVIDAAPLPAAGSTTFFPVVTLANPLPDNAKAAELAAAAVEKWRIKGYKVDGTYIRYDADQPDYKSYEKMAQLFKRRLGSINLVLKRGWFDPEDAETKIGNVGKYARIYAFDQREAARDGESLPSTIHHLDTLKLSFFLIVDEKPDLTLLRQQLLEPSAFMGITYRQDKTAKPPPEENKK